jgi:lactoylglutathione lyase
MLNSARDVRRPAMQLSYAIKFVSNMDEAVAFYRDRLRLEVKFASPFWSEFATGETTLALHPASDENPAGGVELGFTTDDLGALYARREELGIHFTREPHEEQGTHIARIRDGDGGDISVSGPV